MLARNVRNIPITELSSDEFQQILLAHKFSSGSEGIICDTGEPDTLYKFFLRHNEPIPMSNNKVRKTRRLHIMNPECLVHPLMLVSVNGIIMGYQMTYNPSSVTLQFADLERGERIEVLERSVEGVQYLNSMGIIYGDEKSNNILFNSTTGKIEYCDGDNVRMGIFYPFDLKNQSLRHFLENGGKMKYVDAYMSNLLALQQLTYEMPIGSIPEIAYLINRGSYSFEGGFKPEATQIFESMRNPKTFNGQYAIQYVKK